MPRLGHQVSSAQSSGLLTALAVPQILTHQRIFQNSPGAESSHQLRRRIDSAAVVRRRVRRGVRRRFSYRIKTADRGERDVARGVIFFGGATSGVFWPLAAAAERRSPRNKTRTGERPAFALTKTHYYFFRCVRTHAALCPPPPRPFCAFAS